MRTFPTALGRQLKTACVLLTSAAACAFLLSGTTLALTMCELYPTRCNPYSGPMPVGPLGLQGYPGSAPTYTPGQLNPALGAVTRNGLDGLPEHVRRELYPGIDLDAVGNMTEQKLQEGFDKLQPTINGYGPGGSGYTDDTARRFNDGVLTPRQNACQAMGGLRVQGIC